MSLLNSFYTFMTALFTALIVVPFLRQWALDQGTVDVPDERKVHKTPMPRLGGIAIFLSFLLTSIVYIPVTPLIRGFLAGGLIIFITGLVDDLTELSARRKFAGEVAACLVTIALGKLWLSNLGNLFGMGDIILSPWLGVPFTVFAVVGIINAINLIDGLDGLAGGVSMLILAAFFVLGWIEKDQQTALLAAALAGGLLGFLKYNFYPARIFMGDAGSLTVGFVLGFLAVHSTQSPGSTISPMVPVLILGLPLLDTLWVMSRRVLQGSSPFAADRTHVHHKFLDLGFKHRFTVVIIYTLTLFWICSALLLRYAPEYLLLLFLLGTAALFYIVLRYVRLHPEQFTFLRQDAMDGLRNSATYRLLAERVDMLVPALLPLLLVYLSLALWTISTNGTPSWQIALSVLAPGLYLWYRPLTENRQFLLLVLYVAIGIAAPPVWRAEQILFADVTLRDCGDFLLALAGVIVILKITFRRTGEFFLSSADFLTLAVCVFLAIASQQNTLGFDLNGPLLRTVVAILALRTLCSRDMAHYRLMAWATFVFLAGVAVAGFFAMR